MTILQLIFYAFAAMAIGSGLMVVAAKNSVHGVLFLVLTFFAMSGMWILLNAEFLALILLLVYVGAVMTLFLFVVMMLNLDKDPSRESFVRYLPIAALVVVLIIGLIVMVVGPQTFGLLHIASPNPAPADYSNTAALGSVLYTNYAYPFEIAGALLLTSIIAAITLSHHAPKNRKVQSVSKQVDIIRDQRVKLIQIPSEKKMKPTKDAP
jgi:NADH-quinone oxidoreductase subunit J